MGTLLSTTDYILALLQNNADLGLQDVWFGDQELVPRMPAATVEPTGVNSDMAGVAFRLENRLGIIVTIYYGGIQDIQTSQRDSIAYTEKVVSALHADITMGGNVIHGYCEQVEHGVSVKSGAMIYASRISWTGLTKTSE
jgi:hypothetical protein